MQHYFIDKPHQESDYFQFEDEVLNMKLCFRSCDSIFSKDKIDDGTRTLLETIGKKVALTGYGLDLGCGLGAIGISLAKKFGLRFDMVDINNTAVSLSKYNSNLNNTQKLTNIFYSDGFSEIKNMYDFVVTNPPIKTGKKLLFELMSGVYEHLNQTGKLVLVIRKSHGMESLKTELVRLFGNAEIIERNKGYYILYCEKV